MQRAGVRERPDGMTAPRSPGNDPSLEHLLEVSLRPGADREPALSAGQIGEGARRRAGQLRRRRSTVATAFGTGALIAVTLVAVPTLRGIASDDTRTTLPPAAQPSVGGSPTAGAPPGPSAPPGSGSAEPSVPPDPSVSPDPSSGPVALGLASDGYLLVPDEVEPSAADLPDGLDPAISTTDTQAGAFLQNVVPACAESNDDGATSRLGNDVRGARTWTHPGPATVEAGSYAEARVDLFVAGGATGALQALADRATACQGAGLGLTATTTGGEEQPGADGYLLVTGTVPGVEGSAEVAVPPQASALVVVRVGDVLVRGYVNVSGGGATQVEPEQVGRAQALVRAYVQTLGDTRTGERLAATP